MKTGSANQTNRHRALRQKLQELKDMGSRRDDLKIETVADALDQIVSGADRDLAVVRFDGNARLLRGVRRADSTTAAGRGSVGPIVLELSVERRDSECAGDQLAEPGSVERVSRQ